MEDATYRFSVVGPRKNPDQTLFRDDSSKLLALNTYYNHPFASINVRWSSNRCLLDSIFETAV